MRDVSGDTGGTILQQCFGRIAERAAGIDDVVDEDTVLAGHVTDDVHDFGLARAITALVDDREQTVEALGERAGADNAADIRRDDHDIVGVILVLDVACEERHSIEVVGRNIEEALDLAGMQVERQNAVGTGFGDQIGDELGRDRRARTGFAVLAGIAEIGKDGRDAACRGSTEGVDHDQQFHQVVVCRKGRRLNDENVFTTHIFLDLYEDFLVCETADAGLAEWYIEIGADRFGQLPVRITCENLHLGPPVTMLR